MLPFSVPTEWQSDKNLALAASFFLTAAVIHTFLCSWILKISNRFHKKSWKKKIGAAVGEVEFAFGIWAFLFLCFFAIKFNVESVGSYLQRLSFTEPLFVCVILIVASSRPIVSFASYMVFTVSKWIPWLPKPIAFYVTTLTLGPILGSLITEPAAMTLSALIIKRSFFSRGMSQSFLYTTLALLFVHVSIGGTLTSFAAPPVLMVAGPWQWDSWFMLSHFGWKSVLIILVSSASAAFLFRKEMIQKGFDSTIAGLETISYKVTCVQFLFLAVIVWNHQTLKVFIPVFLAFAMWCTATRKFQSPLQYMHGFMVLCFLSGLVALGTLQEWWVRPLIQNAQNLQLYFGATTLTAVLDNAALTYFGSLADGLSDRSKYLLVAGAVTGGGLSVIANAPNPAGHALLASSFGSKGVHPLKLFLYALPTTCLALLVFGIL